jgi:hypothetical protein
MINIINHMMGVTKSSSVKSIDKHDKKKEADQDGELNSFNKENNERAEAIKSLLELNKGLGLVLYF